MSKLVKLLSASSGLSDYDVEKIIRRAPDTYKSYVIPKRSGRGVRIISQPAREVKVLQRILVARLRKLPVHDAAMAYREGVSIRRNAMAHVNSGPIRKYDFEEFFPSILSTDWRNYCEMNTVFSDLIDIDRSISLFFHRPKGSVVLRLAIGAPSSPWLSNVLLYDFDDRITRAVAKDRVVYTRYADDLTFSAPRTGFLTGVDRAVRTIIRETRHPRLKLNEAKTTVATLKYRRVVTGLVLTNDGEVSIGREKKRLIRSMVHHATNGEMLASDMMKLLGLLAHVRSVEPAFYHRLRSHYGAEFERDIRVFYNRATR